MKKETAKLSYKRRLNRLVSLVKKDKKGYGLEDVVEQTGLAPHAAFLGISTKQTNIVFVYEGRRSCLELSWLQKDSYNSLENELAVMFFKLDEADDNTANAFKMFFDMDTGEFYDKAQVGFKERNDIRLEKEFYERAKILNILRGMTNAEKFINDL